MFVIELFMAGAPAADVAAEDVTAFGSALDARFAITVGVETTLASDDDMDETDVCEMGLAAGADWKEALVVAAEAGTAGDGHVNGSAAGGVL